MSLGGGQLIITARRESYNGADYTSARLNTSAKAGWTYGRFEGMIQVPEGQGTWPAFWMLPTDWTYGGWPESGEIDIMEHVGCDPNVVHGTVHTGAYNHTLGTQLGVSVDLSSATSDLHLYAIDWDEERIVFSVDGAAYFTFENDGAGDSDTWPFDQAFHFVLNLAVGGDWGGYCGVDSSAFPQEYRVDWVRVYQ
jgi:beta-glucanase (GH16 family)